MSEGGSPAGGTQPRHVSPRPSPPADPGQFSHDSTGHHDGARTANDDSADDDVGQYAQPPGQPGPPIPYPGYQPKPFGPAAGRANPLAIAALLCGIGQFFLGLLIVGNILLAVPALVLGFVGLRQIGSRGERGRGMAIAGVVLGGLGILYFALVLVVILAVGLSARS